MCSAPVTFGGGIAIEKFSSGRALGAAGRRRRSRASASKIRASTSPGSQRVVASSFSLRSSSIEAAML